MEHESVIVRILNYENRAVDIRRPVSLLNNFLMKGIPIDTVCGGKAQCGRCQLRIVEGMENLSPLRERERTKLESMGVPGDRRLACQSYARGPVAVEIINFKEKLPRS